MSQALFFSIVYRTRQRLEPWSHAAERGRAAMERNILDYASKNGWPVRDDGQPMTFEIKQKYCAPQFASDFVKTWVVWE